MRETMTAQEVCLTNLGYSMAQSELCVIKSDMYREIAEGTGVHAARTRAFEKVKAIMAPELLLAIHACDETYCVSPDWDFTLPDRTKLFFQEDIMPAVCVEPMIYRVRGNQFTEGGPLMCTCAAFVCAVILSNHASILCSVDPPMIHCWEKVLRTARALYSEVVADIRTDYFTSVCDIEKVVARRASLCANSLADMARQIQNTPLGGVIACSKPVDLLTAVETPSLFRLISLMQSQSASAPVTAVVTISASSFAMYSYAGVFGIIDTHESMVAGPGNSTVLVSEGPSAPYALLSFLNRFSPDTTYYASLYRGCLQLT